jgi:hypothetical protein
MNEKAARGAVPSLGDTASHRDRSGAPRRSGDPGLRPAGVPVVAVEHMMYIQLARKATPLKLNRGVLFVLVTEGNAHFVRKYPGL